MKTRRLFLSLVILVFMFKNGINGAMVKEKIDNVDHNNTNKNRDLSSNVTQLIAECGYCSEVHEVETTDGYILYLVRITNRGPAVFLMHGLLNSADDFFTIGPEKSLACILAHAGYDVWLGNVRGNKYSRKHVLLSTKDKAFWNFTFHEMGIYDLPAMIDYALDKSNKSELTYVGHSQGTTVFFVMASLRPEYGRKISRMIAMAPVAWLGHLRTPVLRTAVPFRLPIYLLAETFGFYDILPYDEFWKFVTTKFCPSSKIAMFFCATVLFSVYGYDYEQLNYTQFPVEIGHIPAGVSLKTLLHYAQLVASGKFQQYDDTLKTRNIEAYGSLTPPSYPVHNISVPIAIMHAENDFISVFEDVQELIKNLPNVIDSYRVPFNKFNHMDYLWAKGANQLVNVKALQWIKGKV